MRPRLRKLGAARSTQHASHGTSHSPRQRATGCPSVHTPERPRVMSELDGLLGARVAVTVAELLFERTLELAGPLELLDDVGAADQLALDEDLRDRRPARQLRQLGADRGVREDVDRRYRRACATERLER